MENILYAQQCAINLHQIFNKSSIFINSSERQISDSESLFYYLWVHHNVISECITLSYLSASLYHIWVHHIFIISERIMSSLSASLFIICECITLVYPSASLYHLWVHHFIISECIPLLSLSALLYHLWVSHFIISEYSTFLQPLSASLYHLWMHPCFTASECITSYCLWGDYFKSPLLWIHR